jgi:hypothetical protein
MRHPLVAANARAGDSINESNEPVISVFGFACGRLRPPRPVALTAGPANLSDPSPGRPHHFETETRRHPERDERARGFVVRDDLPFLRKRTR